MSRAILEEVSINAPPEDVWRVAGDHATIGEWVPALAGSTLAGSERECTTGDGAKISERILFHSDTARSYSYEIVESPLPLRAYRSTIAVHGHDGHSHVRWEAEFEALAGGQEAELQQLFTGIYREGLASLRARLEGAEAA